MANVRLIDVHCHLNSPRLPASPEVLAREAREVGVDTIVMAGVRPSGWQQQQALAKIDATRMEILQYEEVGDLMNHVLAGDILSPENTDAVVAAVVEFVLQEPN